MASIKRNKNVIINNINYKLKSINNNSNKDNLENLNIKENNINSNYIEKSFLAGLLKCEICNNIFDLNIHIPMVGKCGHTFCKKCIIEKHFNKKKSNQYDECPLDNMKNIFNIESFVINLRIELIIKKIFTFTKTTISSIQTTPQNMNQKQIVYKKKTKNNNNNQNMNNNDMNLNFQSPNINNKNGEYGYRKLDMNSDSNQKNNYINDNLASPQIEEEMNVNTENKILFEDEKVNGVIINETIDTIPIFEEKSFCNVSFKEDVNELFSKNSNLNKKSVNENIKNELVNKNKNKYHVNTNLKKKPQKKNTESDINQNDKFSKTETNFWLNPNNAKDNQILDNNIINNSNKKKIIMNSNSVGEEEDLTKYRNNTHQVRTVFDKIQLKLNEPIINNYYSESNNNVIVINKVNNKENIKNKNDLYANNRYLQNKKVIHFTNSTTNNNNRLNTNPNNQENKLKMSVVLNKKANILSTNILRKSNNNAIEGKDENTCQDFILSSNKRKIKSDAHLGNSSDNENDILINKNRTYNSKKNNSIHNSILDNIMDNSNNEYLNKNNEVNKNLKVLNKSNNNNNNSSSFANSNSNSVYNKKNIIYSDKGFQNMINKDENEDKEIAQLEKFASVTTKESNNIFKKLNKNSKSQMFDNINSNSNLNIKDDANKLRFSFGKRKNKFESHSTIIVKKSKNTSPIFSTKHTKKNSIIINYNKTIKDSNIDNILNGKKILLNETNMRRANSFITNNNILNPTNNINVSNSQNINTSNSKSQNEAFSNQLTNTNANSGSNQTKEEIKQSLENNLYSLIKKLKFKSININEKKYQEMLEEILNDQNYENYLEKITIKYFDNKDFFIGIMDNNNKYPLKGVLLYHNGDYYNGEFSEGRKNGNGVIKYKNQTRYEGTFKNDRHDGYGKLIQLDGEIFEGEWKNGKINGNGVRLHSNGDKYIGSYVNNIRNGQGHYIFINGDSYNGNWVNGKANGLGTFKFKNGNIYEGEFKDNIILGKGILTMQNGDMYIGSFLNGMLNGKGTYINSIGEKFIGVFERGKKNGEGKLFDKNGKIIKEGIWKNDVFINDSK